MKRRRSSCPAWFPALIASVLLVLLASIPVSAAVRGGHGALGSPEPCETWYFAEGTTRQGFTTYICIKNPGADTEAAVTCMLSTGGEVVQVCQLAPHSRTTLDMVVCVAPGSDFSVKVESVAPVIVERTVYFIYNGSISGGHVLAGAACPADRWYFAEGTTRPGFDTYLCILNPSDDDANADITYFCGDGKVEKRKGIGLPAKSRKTIAVHDVWEGVGRFDGPHGDVSIEVKTCEGQGIVVERPMYFIYGGALAGGHDVIGAPAPSDSWYFAEGCTRPGFDSYLCLSNPGGKDAAINLSFFCGDGVHEERTGIVVPSRSRRTIKLFEEPDGLGRHNDTHGDFAITVESTNGAQVVAERPTYFTYRPYWAGGNNVMGATGPALSWSFAEGCTRNGYETYLCIGNPGEVGALVDVRYLLGDGSVIERLGLEVAEKSRLTVAVHDSILGSGRQNDNRGDVSIEVTSSNGVPVVAERTMYFAEHWKTICKTSVAGNWGWGDITAGNPSKNNVALTFDIEISAGTAERILDILASKNVNATFFLLGTFASSNRGTVSRMVAEGHELGNHSMSHSLFTSLSYAQVASELAGVESIVNSTTGLSTKPYFRFPEGSRNGGLVRCVNSLGYLSVYWTVDPQDWRGGPAEQVLSDVVSWSSNGSIILLHDRNNTVAALPGIIDGLRAKGLKPGTLTETLFPGP